MKFYRGSAAAARSYVEADHSRADDYYLSEGAGVASRFVVDVSESVSLTVGQAPDLDGETYERWVGGYDVDTGAAKGRLRDDANALRFVEVTVNGPKTWSLAAALIPEISAALDAAQDQAAAQIIGWVAEHATTRVGPRGRQVQVPVEQLEAAVIRHHTSRAGDPHRHLHLQINARVFAKNAWRGIHSVGARDSLEAINGIGHAAVVTDPGFRAALAAHGFSLDSPTGEIAELAAYAGRFSARAAQIGRNVEAFEASWRAAHPGQEPGPKLRRTWDRRAWSQARPDKVIPTDGAAMVAAWNDELRALGYRARSAPVRRMSVATPSVGGLDRDAGVEVVLTRLGARRSAWNAADVRGQVEQWIAATGIVVEAAVRIELAEDLTARALSACTPLLDRDDVPEHVRALSSPQAIGVEDRITELLGVLAHSRGSDADLDPRVSAGLDPAQQNAVAALTGTKNLLVIEGAAGSGKTTTHTATKTALASQGRQMTVVTPTLKAAEVAAAEIDAPAFSAAWLVHQWGWRWDGDGHWSQEFQVPTDPAAHLDLGDLLVIDEAGMLDQDTARALLEVAQESQVRVAFLGDPHQLPAVGRGGVLDLATQHAGADATVCLNVVHRFADPTYADLSVAMRRGDPVFDELWEDGHIVLHPSEAERTQMIAAEAAEAILTGHTSRALMADTREQVAALNAAIRDRLVAAGLVDDHTVVTTRAGERLGVGDRVATRRNDVQYGLANRQRWTITAITPATGYVLTTSKDDGPALELTLRNDHGITRQVPSWYAQAWVESAYATTVYGAQGETTPVGHLVLGPGTTAASAYVGMTRGRHDNTAHVIAETPAQARTMWEGACSRERADLGVAHARLQALDDIDRYGPIGHPSVKKVARQPETGRKRALDPAHDTVPSRSPSSSRSGPSIGF
ncbi:MobF family relaxase [Nocardioides sp.]|uniref:MobF family relaxase n=1 Tax=Nocardioides sp. TaxID=35761 RepID=UPI00261265ED|nr:MobF family relaxase [Nocardioides sp.]